MDWLIHLIDEYLAAMIIIGVITILIGIYIYTQKVK